MPAYITAHVVTRTVLEFRKTVAETPLEAIMQPGEVIESIKLVEDEKVVADQMREEAATPEVLKTIRNKIKAQYKPPAPQAVKSDH